mmetsp:Transcript_73415/g.215263  ORF Transcript_73415/g.215263 Transcript_73415/m.215263 type:complete len:356 (+) Transcript_73415:47-1114(+)
MPLAHGRATHLSTSKGDEREHHGYRLPEARDEAKGAISMLQEFVQCSKQFHSPQHRPILQWHFDTRMVDFTTLEFRAVVAFMLDGVVHHTAGTWFQSKKFAQRDAAERALGLFVGRWGEFLLSSQGGQDGNSDHDLNTTSQDEIKVLEAFCRDAPVCAGGSPKWNVLWQGCQCRAVIELNLLGVLHKFSGQLHQSEEVAKTDIARRVLWYLRCPGFDEAYEPDPYACAATAREIPVPPANWVSGSEEEEDAHHAAAERKTALMRVQNRLQQAFARHMRPGQSVWEWSYQFRDAGPEWPPMYQATVRVPVLGRSFVGVWARGQRDAQISASEKLGAFLDSTGPDQCGPAPPAGAVY